MNRTWVVAYMIILIDTAFAKIQYGDKNLQQYDKALSKQGISF